MSSIDDIQIRSNGRTYTLKEVIEDVLEDKELMKELDKYIGDVIYEYGKMIKKG